MSIIEIAYYMLSKKRTRKYLKLIIIIVSIQFNYAHAIKDSTRWDFKLKGIDIKIGKAIFNQTLYQKSNIIIQSTPQEIRGNYDYSDIKLKSGNLTSNPTKIRLNAVLSNQHRKHNWLFHQSEWLIGCFFDIESKFRNGYNIFDSIKLDKYQGKYVTALQYSYQCQGLEIGYQFASKAFKKHFAIFGGLNTSFGVNSYKNIEMIDYYALTDGRKEENINITYSSNYAHIGLKYNMSCDLNLFTQVEYGINFYGKEIGGNALFKAFCVGMRYKIIDESDRPNYLNSAFW